MTDATPKNDSLKIERKFTTLREIALERMREAIIEGLFKPGERLVERQLCERLGVSRSVVREVIRHLESEGLIETIPNQGPRVEKIDAATARQIYEIRMQLEPLAASMCAKAANTETVSKLNSALNQLAVAHDNKDSLSALHATTDFYEIMFQTGGRKIAWEMVRRLNSRICRLRAMTLSSEGRHTTGMEQMKKIVTAISNNDSKEAAKACKSHITEAAKIAEKILKDSS